MHKNHSVQELKYKVATHWFNNYITTNKINKISFIVSPKQKNNLQQSSLLWANAKTGNANLVPLFLQLILTIGKTLNFNNLVPPTFLGAFNNNTIAFIPFNKIQNIFYKNDFNWKVTLKNNNTKEFIYLKTLIEAALKNDTLIFNYTEDNALLKNFIYNNFTTLANTNKIIITKNNLNTVYLNWLNIIHPIITINIPYINQTNIPASNIFFANLYILLVNQANNNNTLLNSFINVLKKQDYNITNQNILKIQANINNIKKNESYISFWQQYIPPSFSTLLNLVINPKEIILPQDNRERKGAFFTPAIWVKQSQQYLTNYLGANWQNQYYIWDCAAGTGNLLAGLTNKNNIYASTIDHQDVTIMQQSITKGANLLKNHVFQFDFLNDDFTKLPQTLQAIINNKEKRKKLIIYINPPYAEATTTKTTKNTGNNKTGLVTQFKVNTYFKPIIGNAANEIFALFMANIYHKIPGCILAQFSTLKFINGSNFKKFKTYFLAKYIGGFIVPAETFDNVKGKFPIAFTIWDTATAQTIKIIATTIFNKNENHLGIKNFYGALPNSINKWITSKQNSPQNCIGTLFYRGNDFQNQNFIYIGTGSTKAHDSELYITASNLMYAAVYFAVRHCITATWLNDRDQFCTPNNAWEKDIVFQNNCLAFTLFHGQNKISCINNLNHWIPFTEKEIHAKAKFTNNFMTNFIKNQLITMPQTPITLITLQKTTALYHKKPSVFSLEAEAVMDAGRSLFTYYHAQNNININASFYDIKAHFQGRNNKGRMNPKSNDKEYTLLITALRNKINILGSIITPKIYAYQFLKT